MGDITELMVPSTTEGKNIIQKPMTKGRSSGNTSIGSALASDCQIEQGTETGYALSHSSHVAAQRHHLVVERPEYGVEV